MAEIVLKTTGLSIHFGGLKAVSNFNVEVKKNQIYGLIGPNGAGKTTVFNMITGVYKPSAGQITLCGKSIANMSQKDITKAGICRTFQNIRLFANMSVLQNVMVAMSCRPEYHCHLWQSVFHTKHHFENEKKMRDEAKELLKVFGIYEKRKELASSLPYGEQRKLEIARALGAKPKLLLLDEPAAGMNPEETEELMATIRLVRDKFDITVLLIEHDMRLIKGVCDEVSVLNFGELLASGTPEEVLSNPEVVKAYLGDDENGAA